MKDKCEGKTGERETQREKDKERGEKQREGGLNKRTSELKKKKSNKARILNQQKGGKREEKKTELSPFS